MKLTFEDYKNLSALLQNGKFSLNAQESVLLVNLVNKVNEIAAEMAKDPVGTPTEEPKSE